MENDGDDYMASDSSDCKRKRKQSWTDETLQLAATTGNEELNEQNEYNEESSKISAAEARKEKKSKYKSEGDEKRIERRRAINRQSASKTRERQKNLVAELQKAIANAYKETNEIRNSNKELQEKLDSVIIENQRLREMHQCTEAVPAPAPDSQMNNAVSVNETVMAPPISTIGNLGDNRTQNVSSNLATSNVSSNLTASNVSSNLAASTLPSLFATTSAGLDANQMNRIVHQVELGAINPSMFSHQGGTPSQSSVTHRNVTSHMPTFDGQMQPLLVSLPGEIAGSVERTDQNNFTLPQQLQQPISMPAPSQAGTGGQNVLIIQTPGQAMQQLASVPSMEINSARTSSNDALIQQIFAVLQQANVSQSSTTEQNRPH